MFYRNRGVYIRHASGTRTDHHVRSHQFASGYARSRARYTHHRRSPLDSLIIVMEEAVGGRAALSRRGDIFIVIFPDVNNTACRVSRGGLAARGARRSLIRCDASRRCDRAKRRVRISACARERDGASGSACTRASAVTNTFTQKCIYERVSELVNEGERGSERDFVAVVVALSLQLLSRETNSPGRASC